MPEDVVYYLTSYGYLAIFILIFLQETGMPNPFPNELLLMFSGYLSFKGILYLPYIILTAVLADFIGTNLLYFLFYYTGTFILSKKPKWLLVSERFLSRLKEKILRGGTTTIFLFRLTPFTRGYASVFTGLLGIKPKVFLPIALVSAIIWSTFYVVAGKLIGPIWDHFSQNLLNFKYLMLAIFLMVLSVILVNNFYRNKEKNKLNAGIDN